MTKSVLDQFKKQSKDLLKRFRAREPRAVERVLSGFHDAGTFTLMNAQHVIAKEYGFTSWKHLLEAPDSELRRILNQGVHSPLATAVQAVLAEQPHLTIFGFRPPTPTTTEPTWTPEQFHRERNELLSADGLEQVRLAIEFFELLRPARIGASSRGSYGLKHSAEAWHRKQGRNAHIANGALIVAALLKGISIRREDPRSPNCAIGVNVRDLAALAAGINPAAVRATPAPFVRWLFAQSERDDAVGDLARDAKDDLRFPRGGLDDVTGYLARYGVHIQEALARASAEWIASRKSPKDDLAR